MDKNQKYQELFQNWKSAYPSKTAYANQKECVAFWNANKDNEDNILKKILDLKSKSVSHKGTLINFLVNHKKIGKNDTLLLAPENPVSQSGHKISSADQAPDMSLPAESRSYPNPAQETVFKRVFQLDESIAALRGVKLSGLITEEQCSKLKQDEKERGSLAKKLKRLQESATRQKAFRDSKKKKLNDIVERHPEIRNEMNLISVRPSPGRPRIEESQPDLLKSIIDLVAAGCSADGRRRTENLKFCRTLDDLHTELMNMGFSLSRSSLYLRLQPRNRNTTEGKRHVNTVPVKLMCAPNDERKNHPDSHFAAATVKFLNNLAEFLGPKSVFVLSQDDKAKVPLGIPASKLQSPLLMHLEYKVRLPDHDFVVAPQHRLIPSVYAATTFDKQGRLGYSGPTYIAIRSGKHDKSSAGAHSRDLRYLLNLDIFSCIAKEDNAYKPIIIIKVDGGPDENPRFPSVLKESISNFRKLDIDALYIVTQAPGNSAYNPVERRMAPLSKDLAGLILPHNHFGTHLDSQGKTIDAELEKVNFCKAGQCLAEVWSQSNLDGYDVIAEYISPEEPSLVDVATEEWKCTHVRQSQYLLQIVKCDDIVL